MAISHIFTNPVPDGTITSIVRPSDWNSAHNQYYTLSGNVLGASTVSGTNVVLQAAGNVSLSGVNQTIVISGSNTPQPTSYVSNVNGISGQVSLNAGASLSGSTNGSSITFALASNITTALQSANPNYLTTQTVQTQASVAIAGTGFTSTTTAGTAVTGALGTNGINLGIPAYLTTARASNDGVGLNTAQTNVTWTVNSGGISLNAGAYLTTARASNDGVGLNTAQTNVTWTVNSGGISLNAGAYLTTQTVQTQASGGIVGSGFTSTTTTGTAVVGTLNSSGLSLGVPAFITAGGGGGNFSGGVSNLGNTAGSTGITGTRVVFVGTNNISLSQSTDANGATISINQTGGGGGGIAAAAGGQTATSGTVNFANSNGITFGMSQSSQITASYTVPTSYVSNVNGSSGQISLNVGSSLSASTNGSSITFGLVTDITTALQSANANYLTSQSNQAFSASGGSSTFQTLNFANSNGVTFSNTNGSVRITHDLQFTSNTSAITANAFPSADTTKFAGTGTTAVNATVTLNSNGINISVAAPGGGGNFSGGVSNLGNTAGSTGITGTRVVFVGTNNISLSQSTDANGATISINQTGGGGGAMYANLSGNTAGNSTASGNTLNFSGINVTLSGTNNSQIAISAPATSGLSAGNNISLSTNGSTINISAQAVALGAGTQTATSGTIILSNANGISFGMSGSSRVTASYTQRTTYAFSASGGSSSWATLNFANSNGITFTNTNASVAIAHDLQYTSNTSNITSNAFPSADTTKFAGTGTSATNASITLNSNGLAISVAAPGGGGNFSGGVSNLGNTAGSTGITGTRIVFVGTNNISLSQSTDANGATISFDQTGGGGGAMYANLSGNTAGNSTASGNTLNFSGINVTLSGTNASQIAISAPATSSLAAGNNISLSTNGSTIGLSAQAVAVGAGTQTATSGTIVFSNSNGISFGLSGSTRVTASYTQLNQAFSASGGSSSFQTLNFANSNGLTFSNSNGSVVASYTVPDTTGFAGTGTSATNASVTLDSNGLAISVAAPGAANYSIGVSNLGNTAGSTGITGTRIVFVGTNNISLSQSTDANGATISIDQTGGGGGGLTNINVSAGTTSNNLSNIVFSNTNGVSFGLNGSTVTASVAADYTMSGYYHYNDVVQSLGTQGNGTLCFDHVDLDNNVQFDRFGLLFGISNAANSTGSHTVSVWVGLYTQNASSISQLTSTSTSFAATQSGTVGSYSLYSGVRQVTIPITTTLTKGEYIIGVVSRTSSAGANGSYSMMLQSNLNSDYRGFWGSAVDATNQIIPALGHYSTSTTGLPVSVAYSQIRGTNANAQRPPIVMFHSGTF